MVERDRKATRAAARPLLAYAPEFLETVSLSRVFLNDEEREHQRRREELLRRKQELLDAEQNGKLDPAADMQGRMNAVREALQANLEGAAVRAQPAPEISAEPESEPVTVPRRRRRWGLLAGFTLLGGIIGTAYAFLVPPQYAATASMQVFPPERRSEIASNAVLERAAQMARITRAEDLGKPSFQEELRARLNRLLPEDLQSPASKASGVELLRERLDFTQALDSGTVNVEATAHRPETAALLANAVAHAFRDHLQGGAPLSGAEGNLPARLQSLEADAEAARQAAATFRVSRDFGDDDNKAALQREFADSKAETARIAAEANSLNGASAESLAREGVPESMRSGALGALVERYRTAGQGAEAKQIEVEVDKEISSQRSILQADLKNAVEREQKAAAAIAGFGSTPATDEDKARLQMLERAAAAKQALFEDLQMRAARGETSAAGSAATVRIIAPALAEANRRDLPPQWIIAVGFLGGFLLGLLSMALAGRKAPSPRKTDAELEEVLEPYGETRLAAVIREANARWEAENEGPRRPKENAALGRAIDDVRSSRASRP
ncbi:MULTISPECIES: Wzz/FepE/Etk N-terminal domain-containing protein [unclassified Ochrobactrum]|uniref:Wzz/FepE/Etk N-terminal domain-containing protein n=1 Tax=unclassified Ochrobactrum TaxID=239106 RepID=UPI000DEF4AEC|nr:MULTISPECIES: Wzz/FepE/Etk N-terminal domain-containing protein [unclassified Ochrobactrum]MBQ0707800.1 lipopolysaccharide biosynthesis protein [Ochrobactrum sp. AP1BH01-1]